MSVITFDTLKFSKKLVESGVPQRQAEAHAEAFAEVIDDQLATKQDLKDLETRLNHNILTRLGGLVIATVGIGVTILGLLISAHH